MGYDATQFMEYAIDHGEDLGIDLHNIVFTGNSAGIALMNYLTWNYPRKNHRYTPKGSVFCNAQVAYPPQQMQNTVASLVAQQVGDDFLLKDFLAKGDCNRGIGNSDWCNKTVKQGFPDLCNKTWNIETQARYCDNPDYDKLTIGHLAETQVWTTP